MPHITALYWRNRHAASISSNQIHNQHSRPDNIPRPLAAMRYSKRGKAANPYLAEHTWRCAGFLGHCHYHRRIREKLGREMTPSELRERRSFLGYTQLSFAEKLGLSRRTIQAYELGETSIPKVLEMALETIELEEK